MDFMGKDLKEIVVVLPLADGSELKCGVYASFDVNSKSYMALLPLLDEKNLDYTKNYMLYEVEKDEEDNPIVLYIEDDLEYVIASKYFTDNYLDKHN